MKRFDAGVAGDRGSAAIACQSGRYCNTVHLRARGGWKTRQQDCGDACCPICHAASNLIQLFQRLLSAEPFQTLGDVRPGPRWSGKRTLPACRLRNLRQNFAQCRAKGNDCVGVIRVRWRTFSVEMGPLVHPSSPFDIGFPDKFFQVII